jgi:diguanylate cyclase (GGDEF)-like protein
LTTYWRTERGAGTAAADLDGYNEHLELARAGKASTHRVLLQDGRVIQVSHQALQHGGWVATHEDVTESVKAEAQIAANAEILTATLENMDQGLLMVDADGRVPVCNQRALELLDLPAALMASKPTFEAVRQYQLERGEFANAPATMRNWVQASGVEATHHVYERERPNGTVLEVRTVPLHNGGAVRTFTDITARKAAERKIEHMARHDPLTDLPNRTLFREALEKRLAEVDRHGGTATVLCLDLDGFKAVNDQFGHAAGDALLQEVAARLRDVVRTEDTVARLGGDEFVVLKVGGGKISGAAALAQRIIASIREDVRVESNLLRVGVSIGIAIARAMAWKSRRC